MEMDGGVTAAPSDRRLACGSRPGGVMCNILMAADTVTAVVLRLIKCLVGTFQKFAARQAFGRIQGGKTDTGSHRKFHVVVLKRRRLDNAADMLGHSRSLHLVGFRQHGTE